MEASLQSFWDPLHDEITVNSFTTNTQKLENKVNDIRIHPTIFILKSLLQLVIAVGISAVSLYFQIYSYLPYAISVLIIISYYLGIKKKQEEVIFFLVCEENHWAYNPDKDTSRADRLAVAFNDIFQKGYDRYVSDQIWGNVENNNHQSPFWRCDFTYTEGSGKSTHTYNEAVLATQCEKAIPINFSLQHAGFFERLGETIKTESDEFNKQFLIIAGDSSVHTKEAIMRVLSPSVQVRLIEFSKQYPLTLVSFNDDIMTLKFSQQIWQPKYTSIFNLMKIDPQDVTNFNNVLHNIVAIPAEMMQYIE